MSKSSFSIVTSLSMLANVKYVGFESNYLSMIRYHSLPESSVIARGHPGLHARESYVLGTPPGFLLTNVF